MGEECGATSPAILTTTTARYKVCHNFMVWLAFCQPPTPNTRGLVSHMIKDGAEGRHFIISQTEHRKLLQELNQLGLPATNNEVIKATVAHFNLGPQPHKAFEKLVCQLAESCQVSVHGSPVRALCGATRAGRTTNTHLTVASPHTFVPNG